MVCDARANTECISDWSVAEPLTRKRPILNSRRICFFHLREFALPFRRHDLIGQSFHVVRAERRHWKAPKVTVDAKRWSAPNLQVKIRCVLLQHLAQNGAIIESRADDFRAGVGRLLKHSDQP